MMPQVEEGCIRGAGRRIPRIVAFFGFIIEEREALKSILTGYSVTTILPRCRLASMCSNALPISSNANTLSIGS